ncbi:hypothetical protein CSW32_07865, partial [Thermus scotoductus]
GGFGCALAGPGRVGGYVLRVCGGGWLCNRGMSRVEDLVEVAARGWGIVRAARLALRRREFRK